MFRQQEAGLTEPLLGRAPENAVAARGRRTEGEGFWAGLGRVFRRKSGLSAAVKEVPRKVPMRIEPKVFFANERTFLSWLHMAVTIGSIGSAILAFATDPDLSPASSRLMASVGIMLLPVAIMFATYAAVTFNTRAMKLRKREEGSFEDRRGPLALACVMFLALLGIFVMSLLRLFE
eukprot:jgi/Chlat1/6532/Chrsp45S06006